MTTKSKGEVYTTQYKHAGFIYGSYIRAKSLKAARYLAQVRGLDERIEGKFTLFKHETWVNLRLKRKLKSSEQRLHYLTFLANVALKSGVYSVDQVMGDTGWFHEHIHTLHISEEPLNMTRAEFDQVIYAVEKQLGFTV